jgi:hypothetical protein
MTSRLIGTARLRISTKLPIPNLPRHSPRSLRSLSISPSASAASSPQSLVRPYPKDATASSSLLEPHLGNVLSTVLYLSSDHSLTFSYSTRRSLPRSDSCDLGTLSRAPGEEGRPGWLVDRFSVSSSMSEHLSTKAIAHSLISRSLPAKEAPDCPSTPFSTISPRPSRSFTILLPLLPPQLLPKAYPPS